MSVDRPAPNLEPVQIAVVNDYELVVRGLYGMLAPHRDRVVVRELDSDVPVGQPVDLALYDTYSMESLHGKDLDEIMANARVGKVVLYTWNQTPEVINSALQRGVRGIVSKAVDVEGLLDALERIHQGEIVVRTAEAAAGMDQADYELGDWPGQREGLTARESEIIALITQGLSNDEIARRLYLSINTVKTYIRSAYRRMGVASRSQAVLWGVDHGFAQKYGRIHPAPLDDLETQV